MQGHRGKYVIDTRHINTVDMGGIAGHDLVHESTELLAVSVLEELGASLSARAHYEDILTRDLALLALKRQGEGECDIADLVIGKTATVVLGEDDRRIECHRIREREALLDIGKQRIIDMHAIFETHGKRNDMTCEVHAELKIATEIKVVGIPDALEHLGDHVPNLVGNYETFIGTIRTSIQRLLARKVNGDIGNFLLWEPNVESLLDTQSHTPGHRKLTRCT